LYREALQLRLAEETPDEAAIANTQFNLAWALTELEQYPESELLFKEAVARRLKHFGPVHRDTALARIGLIAHYLDAEKLNSVPVLLKEVVDTFRKLDVDSTLPDAAVAFQRGVFLSHALGNHVAGEKEMRKA